MQYMPHDHQSPPYPKPPKPGQPLPRQPIMPSSWRLTDVKLPNRSYSCDRYPDGGDRNETPDLLNRAHGFRLRLANHGKVRRAGHS